MNTKKILSGMAILSFFLFSCTHEVKNKNATLEQNVGSEPKIEYVCPMHPEIKSEKQARCSTCGMDLQITAKVGSSEKKDTLHQ